MRSPNGDWVELSEEDLKSLIDREAKKRLHMSGEAFVASYKKGELPNTAAVSEIGMLLRLGTL